MHRQGATTTDATGSDWIRGRIPGVLRAGAVVQIAPAIAAATNCGVSHRAPRHPDDDDHQPLTLWQTTLVTDPNSDAHYTQLLSLLAGQFSGATLSSFVAVTGSVLLIFATNTAIIGCYHVFLALTRMGFLPRAVELRNAWRRTPHVAILAAVAPPVVLVFVAGQSSAASVFSGIFFTPRTTGPSS
jgi:amino acid transporter